MLSAGQTPENSTPNVFKDSGSKPSHSAFHP